MKTAQIRGPRFLPAPSVFPLAFLSLTVFLAVEAAAANLPFGRIDYAAQYFPPLGGIVMQGGWGEASQWEPVAETWKLDASGWQPLTVQNAPALAHHGMTYDDGRRVLVVCGQAMMGMGAHRVWEFNGTAWTQTAELTGSDWGDAEIAYDQNRQRLIIYRASMDGAGETWEYDGSTWRKMAYAQQPVACWDGALFKYDPGLKKTVLTGAKEAAAATETWLWDGAAWTQAAGPQPQNATTGGMVYDLARNQLILLATDMKTYGFDGAGWTQLHPAHSPTPGAIAFFNLAYDSQRQVSAFFGGEAQTGGAPTYPTNTWEWNGTDWKEFSPGAVTPVSVRLTIRLVEANQVRVSWPVAAKDWLLMARDRLDATLSWQTVNANVTVANECSVTWGTTNAPRFFLLKQP